MAHLHDIDLFVFDIDGTLTDGTTTWLGPQIGWIQRYSVRDGEALLRLSRTGLHVVPLSRNATECARARMTSLSLTVEWLGVSDKVAAFDAILHRFGVTEERAAFMGDSLDDVPVLERVGLSFAPRDAHPSALRAARQVTSANAGRHAVEEVVEWLLRDGAKL